MNRETYGALIGAVTIACSLLPPSLLLVAVALLSYMMARELSDVLGLKGLAPYAFLAPAFFWIDPAVGGIYSAFIALVYGSREWNLNTFFYSFFVMLYTGLFPSYILSVREEGYLPLITLILTIWAHDISAYYLGRKYGKRVLFERLSPKKTLEGYIFGFTAGTAVFLALSGENLMRGIIVAFLVLGSGALGDYFKSFIKRQKGIKDFSSLLGEHGGFIDRFDALIFSAPVYFWVLYRV